MIETLADLVAGQDLVGGTGRQTTPVTQQHHMGRPGRQLLQMVGDQDRCEIRVGVLKRVDPFDELLAAGDVKAGRRLVEQQQSRTGHESPSDQRTAPFPLGQGGPACTVPIAEAEQGNETVGIGDLLGRRLPAGHAFDGVGQSGQDNVLDPQGRARIVPRVHMADVRAQLPHVDPSQPVAQYLHDAASGVRERPEETEQGALARPIGAEQRPVLTGSYGQRHLTQNRIAVADDIHIFHAQYRGCAHEEARPERLTADMTAWTDAVRTDVSQPAPQQVTSFTRHSA